MALSRVAPEAANERNQVVDDPSASETRPAGSPRGRDAGASGAERRAPGGGGAVPAIVRWLPRSFRALAEASLANPRLWTGLAWNEVVQSYRRTMLGPAWISLNLVIFTVAMTLVYGALFSVPTREYAAFLACGMIGWFWVAALLGEVGYTFMNSSAFLKSTAIDKSVFVWATVFKQVIILGHHLAVYLVLVAIDVVRPSAHTLLLIPAVVVMFALSIPITAIASILFARYRDLPRLVSSMIIVILLVTPVFWQPSMIKGWRTLLFEFNPIYYIVEFLRAPLLGRPEDPLVVAVVLGMTGFLWLVGAAFYRRYERYVVFWL